MDTYWTGEAERDAAADARESRRNRMLSTDTLIKRWPKSRDELERRAERYDEKAIRFLRSQSEGLPD